MFASAKEETKIVHNWVDIFLLLYIYFRMDVRLLLYALHRKEQLCHQELYYHTFSTKELISTFSLKICYLVWGGLAWSFAKIVSKKEMTTRLC